MANEQSVDMDALRERFPWAGLASTDKADLSSRYRDIMGPIPTRPGNRRGD